MTQTERIIDPKLTLIGGQSIDVESKLTSLGLSLPNTTGSTIDLSPQALQSWNRKVKEGGDTAAWIWGGVTANIIATDAGIHSVRENLPNIRIFNTKEKFI